MSGQDKDKASTETTALNAGALIPIETPFQSALDAVIDADDLNLSNHPHDRSPLNQAQQDQAPQNQDPYLRSKQERESSYQHNKQFPQGDHPFDKQYADSDDTFISDIISSENISSEENNSDILPGRGADLESPAYGPESTSSIVQSGGSGTGIIEPGYGGIVEPPGDDPHEGEGKVMSVIDHLDELRVRLVRCLLAFGLAMGVTFTYGKQIIQFLEKPAGNMTFQALSIEEPLFVYCKVAFYGALIIAAPYLLYEICGFVAPGLKKNERRMLSPIVIGGPLLFVTGAAFCYYCVLPPMLSFFTSFGVGISPVQQRLDFYISLVTTMLFYLGLCFQLPIVLFALSLAGIVNSKQLLGWWRHAMVGSSVAAAIITPDPTVVSMLIVTVALIGLYFFTVALLKVFGR